MLKTFLLGWSDVQLPGGTVVWTSPTGHVYTTEPEGGHWFPALGDPTGEPALQPVPPATAGRCLKMPLRQRSRKQSRLDAINAERTANHRRLEQAELDHQALLEATYEPPPF